MSGRRAGYNLLQKSVVVARDCSHNDSSIGILTLGVTFFGNKEMILGIKVMRKIDTRQKFVDTRIAASVSVSLAA
jgi:hypothetical protein